MWLLGFQTKLHVTSACMFQFSFPCPLQEHAARLNHKILLAVWAIAARPVSFTVSPGFVFNHKRSGKRALSVRRAPDTKTFEEGGGVPPPPGRIAIRLSR